jgi:hypothetical protein
MAYSYYSEPPDKSPLPRVPLVRITIPSVASEQSPVFGPSSAAVPHITVVAYKKTPFPTLLP